MGSLEVASLPRRIASKIAIDEATGCWLWTGYVVRRNGYGRVSSGSKPTTVHRLVYRLLVGPIENQLDHLCRVRHCCNPAHLEDVTNKENVLRGDGPTAVNARKTHCKRGHELTPENTYLRPNGYRNCRVCASGPVRRTKGPKSKAVRHGIA